MLICLFFTHCSIDKKDKQYEFNKQESILFRDIDYPEILGVTMQLVKMDSLLIINDFHGDSLINIFNLNTKKIERKLISKGEGPNELLSPLDIQKVDDNLYVLSRPIFSLNHISLKSILNKEDCNIYKDYQMPPRSDCFLPLTTSQFLFSGLWEKRYAHLNTTSNIIQEFGEYPDFWEDEKSISKEAKAMFHQCFFGRHPTQNLFVSCSGYVLEIYSYNDKGIELPTLLFKKQLGIYSYDYTLGNAISANLKKGSDPCVTELASSNNYIYLVVQAKENRKKRDIMVIDWEGNPIRLLKSDKRITCLTIAEDEKKGYCIIEDPEDKLACFDI